MYEAYLNKIEDVGKLRNLKPGTIRTYKNNVRDFLKFINKHPDDLTCEDARDFLLYLKNKGDKASTLNNKNGALVFFYKRVLGTWPSRDKLINYSAIVVIFMVAMMVIIGLLDLGASQLVNLIMTNFSA